jgi:spermidine/putrescine transport system permease protein
MTRGRDALLLGPAVAVVCGVLVLPLMLLFAISFWSVQSFRLQPDLSLAAWVRFFTSYGGLTLYTLGIAFLTAAICVALGFTFALLVRFKAGRFADFLVLATLVTLFGGYLVKVYAWKTILGADGILNQALMSLGLVDAPVAWLLYSRPAVVITLVHFLLPLAILPLYAALRNVSETAVEAARDLGATTAQVLARVILPQCRLGLFAAFAFCFLLTAGDYVTPLLLGGPGGSMLGQFIALEFSTRFNWPAGAAMSFGLLGASLIVIAGIWRATAPRKRP